MLLDVFAHRFPALEKVFTERIDQRGQFFLAAFPGYVDAFVFPEGGPILVAALPEVSSDMANAAIILIVAGIIHVHAALDPGHELIHLSHGSIPLRNVKRHCGCFHNASFIHDSSRCVTGYRESFPVFCL
jgi:hypothetical protein